MALILRTCAADMTSSGGFRWPESGPVEAPDWDPAPKCGGGLHGLLWGEGDGALLCWDGDALLCWDGDSKWLVVDVADDAIVTLDGKVKFPRGVVMFCGDRKAATDYLVARAPGRAVVGAFVTVGSHGTATAGYYGTATAGYYGTATAGVGGTATAGYYGTATAGVGGTATAGYRGTATVGSHGTATAGYYGTATAGYYGTATAGDHGRASAGVGGTATAGYQGRATAGDHGRASAGVGGILSLEWHDGRRRRVTTLYVGEDGIEPGVPYRLDNNGKPVRVTTGEEG